MWSMWTQCGHERGQRGQNKANVDIMWTRGQKCGQK
jgi:hypothetical protein